MNVAEYNKLKGWIDYERSQLSLLNKKQRIHYLFNKRIKQVLINPLDEMYGSLMQKKESSSTLLCLSTCICCSIEAFGRFITGNKGRPGVRFRRFVKDYMHKDYFSKDFNGEKYVDLLWENYRNGLAHGFAIKHGGFQHDRRYFFIEVINGVNVFEIDPKHFYKDFLGAIKKYANQLRKSKKNDEIYLNFNKAFEEIFIKGV